MKLFPYKQERYAAVAGYYNKVKRERKHHQQDNCSVEVRPVPEAGPEHVRHILHFEQPLDAALVIVIINTSQTFNLENLL